jgi:glycosyltransferase involved in cell wall biosynthesis
VAVSEYAKSVLLQACPASEKKIRVIYHGKNNIPPDDRTAEDLRYKFGIDGEYFLTNSKFVPYSNLHNLVAGYALAKEEFPKLPKLLLAGGDASAIYKKTVLGLIESRRLKGEVVPLGLIPNAANLSLMRSSRLFLFSTLLEACPNTLIEAMSQRCLIACSDRQPLREIAGDSVIYFDPVNPVSIAETIIKTYEMNRESADAIREKAGDRSRIFDWKNTAAKLLNTLSETTI